MLVALRDRASPPSRHGARSILALSRRRSTPEFVWPPKKDCGLCHGRHPLESSMIGAPQKDGRARMERALHDAGQSVQRRGREIDRAPIDGSRTLFDLISSQHRIAVLQRPEIMRGLRAFSQLHKGCGHFLAVQHIPIARFLCVSSDEILLTKNNARDLMPLGKGAARRPPRGVRSVFGRLPSQSTCRCQHARNAN